MKQQGADRKYLNAAGWQWPGERLSFESKLRRVFQQGVKKPDNLAGRYNLHHKYGTSNVPATIICS